MAGRVLTEKQRIWLKHVDDCAASGVSMRAYADRHGLDVQRFYVWKSQLKQRMRSNNHFYRRDSFPARLTVLAMMRGRYGWAGIDGEAADLAEAC